MTKRPNIFEHHDYRLYLRRMFAYFKAVKPNFSYRFLARKAGFASPNFIKLVSEKKRNLTHNSLAKVARGFDLKKKERTYFENLVFMNQASSHDEMILYYKKLMGLKGSSKICKLEKAQYNYFSNWYYPAVREIVLLGPPGMDAKTIAGLLDPEITASQAVKALDDLVELELIRQDDNGLWKARRRAVTTGAEVRSAVVANYHRAMIDLGARAIEAHPRDKRDISCLTLSINQDNLPEIKERIAGFRKELLDLACGTEAPDRVIQVNFQCFPLTKTV